MGYLGKSAAALLAALGAACTGDIGDLGAEEPSQPPGSEPGAAAPSGAPAPGAPSIPGTPGVPAAGAGACKGGEPGPAPIRRLNRFEYDNTVRDLLGDTSQPARDFPAEEKAFGFDNAAEGRSVSPFLAEQYFLTAERLAGAYVDRTGSMLPAVYGCDPAPAGDDGCAQKIIAGLGRRAYRRPVSPEDTQLLTEAYRLGKASGGFKAGITVMVASMLQSPRFLYRVETAVPLDGWEMASRLSYLLWGTMPDAVLFAAAEQGRLGSGQAIAEQVQRMLADKKARAMVARFHEQWLELERIEGIEKEAKTYPKFNAGIAPLMAAEARRFVDHLFWEGAGDLPGLLTASYTFVDPTLARFYGLVPPAMSGSFQRVELDVQKRAGLLTQGGLMAMLGNPNQSSPVRRGQFVREQLLCQMLPPPPGDAIIELPRLDPNATTRERFSRHATDPACAGCHSLMDPIGLGFENFDGIGLWRDTEGGQPVDATGEVKAVGWDGRFVGAVALGRKLAASPEVSDCAARSWFRFAYGRAEQPGIDDCSLELIRRRFSSGGHKLRDLVAALTETDVFLSRRVPSEGGAP